MGNYKDHIKYSRRWLYLWVPLLFVANLLVGDTDTLTILKLVFYLFVGSLIWIGGSMLPDVDSPQSKPNQLAMQVLAVVTISVSMSVYYLLCAFAVSCSSRETVLFIFCTIVIGLWFNWFVIHRWVQNHTHHRGRWHSIGAALIYGILVFGVLFAGGTALNIAITLGLMGSIGYVNHLVCDEIFSAEPERGHELFSWRFIFMDPDHSKKKSAGTALKLWSKRTEALKDG